MPADPLTADRGQTRGRVGTRTLGQPQEASLVLRKRRSAGSTASRQRHFTATHWLRYEQRKAFRGNQSCGSRPPLAVADAVVTAISVLG